MVIFRDSRDQFRFRLVAANGEIVATSESYTTRHDAERAAERVRDLAVQASVEFADIRPKGS